MLCIEHSSKEYAAVKIIKCPTDRSSQSRFTDRLRQEVEIWRECSHPNIVQFRELYSSPVGLWIVMDLVLGGELFEKIVQHDHFCERLSAKILHGALLGLQYLHALQIVHRDIKPENLLLVEAEFSLDGSSEVTIKICDFGIASKLPPSGLLTDVVGSPGYLAPEILLCRQPRPPGYHTSVDIWSLGVLMYILLCGAPPFIGETEADTFALTLKAEPPIFPFFNNLSESARDLLFRSLHRDPSQRITAEQALKHQWFSDISSLPTWDHCNQTLETLEPRKMMRESNLLLGEPSSSQST